MPTKRYYVAAVVTGQLLVVAGGWGESGRLGTVEMMDTKTLQWFTVTGLPQRLSMATAIVCKDNLYVLGGLDEKGNALRAVYSCSMSEILRSSATPRSVLADRKHTSGASSSSAHTWQRLTDLPFYEATSMKLCDELVAIGGRSSDYNPTPAVHVYNSSTDTWDVVSAMLMARYRCLAVVLPEHCLMVVGSHTSFGVTDDVEFGYVL